MSVAKARVDMLSILIRVFCSLFSANNMGIPLPSASCKEAGSAAAMRTAIAGIATCLPDATEVQTIANSVSACSSIYSVFLAWIAILWKAICYLISSEFDPTDIEADITELQADVAAIEAQLPTPHTGTPTFSPNAAVLGTGATTSIQAGSDDLQGAIIITFGTGPTAAGGHVGDIVFGTQFTNVVWPTVSASGKVTGGLIPNTFVSNNGPITSVDMYLFAPAANLAVGNTVKIYYRIGYTS